MRNCWLWFPLVTGDFRDWPCLLSQFYLQPKMCHQQSDPQRLLKQREERRRKAICTEHSSLPGILPNALPKSLYLTFWQTHRWWLTGQHSHSASEGTCAQRHRTQQRPTSLFWTWVLSKLRIHMLTGVVDFSQSCVESSIPGGLLIIHQQLPQFSTECSQ